MTSNTLLCPESTCRMDVHDFSKLKQWPMISVSSPTFSAHGLSWCLKLYPRGENIFTGERNQHISIYLYLDSQSMRRPEYLVNLSVEIPTLNMVSKSPQARSYKKGGIMGWGGSKLVKRCDVLERGCVDDILTIRVTIQIIPNLWAPTSNSRSDLLKIINDPKLADITFLVGQDRRPIRANRLVLETRVPGMKHIWEDVDNMEDSTSDTADADPFDGYATRSEISVIPLLNVDADQFKVMLKFIYSNDASFLQDGKHDVEYLKQLLALANRFGCWKLKVHIEKTMIEDDTVLHHSIIDLLLFADSFDCAMLKEAAMKIISHCSEPICDHPDYDQLKGCDDLLKQIEQSQSSKKAKGSETAGSSADKYCQLSISDLYRRLEGRGVTIESDGNRQMLLDQLKLSE